MLKITKTPDKEQKEAIKFILNHNKGIICYATGTGKSICMLSSAYLFLKNYEVDNVFLIGTNEALTSIKKEIEETFPTCSYYIKKEFQQGKKGLILLNYTELEEVLQYIPTKNNVLMLDEYHKIKTRSSKITKTCTKFKKFCKYKYGFTATPVMKNFQDLHNLVSWMDSNLLGSWQQFCQRYTLYYKFETGKGFTIYNPYKFINLEGLQKKLREIIISYYPDYDIQYKDIYCKLEDKEGYSNVIKEALTPTGDENKDKALPMLAVNRCKSFVSNSKEKLSKLIKIVEKLIYQGVIVYCDVYETLNPVYDTLKKNGFEVLKYTGKQSKTLNKKSMDKFVKDPSNKVLLLSRVAGASLNLHVTNRLIMFDMPSSVGAIQQLMGRIARKYSKFKTYFIYMILTKGTVEEYFYKFVSMYAEPLKKLFSNGIVPSGIPNYNEFIKKQLIKDYVWSYKK